MWQDFFSVSQSIFFFFTVLEKSIRKSCDKLYNCNLFQFSKADREGVSKKDFSFNHHFWMSASLKSIFYKRENSRISMNRWNEAYNKIFFVFLAPIEFYFIQYKKIKELQLLKNGFSHFQWSTSIIMNAKFHCMQVRNSCIWKHMLTYILMIRFLIFYSV